MKKYIYYIAFIGICISCSKKKSQPINNQPISSLPIQAIACDTINVSYSCMIQPILNNNCYQCHSTAVTDTGTLALDLQTFQSFKTYLKLFYKNDSIYGSKFYNTIMQSPTTLPMPPAPANKLQSSELRAIKKWIDLGAIQN
jgi:hypothetical protein